MIFTKLLTPEVINKYPCFEIMDKKGNDGSYSDIQVKMRVRNCAQILMEVQNTSQMYINDLSLNFKEDSNDDQELA